jgi:hypothetical protein
MKYPIPQVMDTELAGTENVTYSWVKYTLHLQLYAVRRELPLKISKLIGPSGLNFKDGITDKLKRYMCIYCVQVTQKC